MFAFGWWLTQLATVAVFLCAALRVPLDFAPIFSPVFHGQIQAATAQLATLCPVGWEAVDQLKLVVALS